MTTLGQIYQNTKEQIGEKEARWLLEERLGISATDLITNKNLKLEQKQIDNIVTDIKQRLAGKPLSKILGFNEFWGRKFKVTNDVLDPRPDTEVLIEHVLSWYKKSGKSKISILDIGTGSGCIALTLLKEIPQSTATAIDISEAALNIAHQNAKEILEDPSICTFIQGEWYPENQKKYDLIVSNPPYIETKVIENLDSEVRNHDPMLALDGGQDGLDAYKKILQRMKYFLCEDGRAFFEIGYDQEESVSRLVKDSRFTLEGVHRDYAENPRVVEISCGDK